MLRLRSLLEAQGPTCGLAGLWAGLTCTGWGWSLRCCGAGDRAAPSHPAQGAQLGADPERSGVSVSDEAGNPGFYEKSNF